MSDLIGTSGGNSSISFWRKPEGKTGMVFLAGLIGLGVWALAKLIPFFTWFFTSLLHIGILALGVGVLWYVITDKQVRTLAWYMFRSLMRAITGLYIELDPIGIVENYIRDLRQRIVLLRQQISLVKGQIRALDERIVQNETEREQSMKLMTAAKAKGKENVLVFQARRAGRRQSTSMTYKKMKERLEIVYRVLVKLAENAELVAMDKEDEVDQAKINFKTMKKAQSAFRSAMSVLKGDPDKVAIFEQAMEHMANEVAMANGEIDVFLDTSRGFLESLDLQNMSYEEDALKMLEDWEKRSDTLLLKPGEKQLLLAESSSPLTPLELSNPQPVTISRRDAGQVFDDFLEKK